MKLGILFQRLGPYHHARLRAAANVLDLLAVEVSSLDAVYAWDKVDIEDGDFRCVTLLHDKDGNAASYGEVSCRVCAVLDQFKPDTVAIPGWSEPAAFAALTWCVQTRVPAIVMSDSTATDQHRVWWKEYVKSRVVRLFSAGFVAGQRHEAYLALLGMGTPYIVTGYDVVDNSYFWRGAAAARQAATSVRYKYKLPQRYFLTSSRFVDEKNLFRLLDAYAQYLKKTKNEAWHLILLGDGPLYAELQCHISRLELAEKVLLPGFKQYADLPSYYGLAGAFILASISETWGLVVNEAMASGVPVLVSNRCGCAPDLVAEGRNGYTFDPHNVMALADLMVKLAADNCDRVAMGQVSREIINRWSPQTFADNLGKASELAMIAPRVKANILDKALLWALPRR